GESGGDARPIGDAEGDVAGQGGGEEAHGQVADLEGHRSEVGSHRPEGQVTVFGGQVPQGVAQDDVLRVVGDVESAEEEPQGHEQAAAGDEGDHIADPGQQHAFEVRACALPCPASGSGGLLLVGAADGESVTVG